MNALAEAAAERPAEPSQPGSEPATRAPEQPGSAPLALPGADAPGEAWDAFYARLGRPQSPEGYEFALPTDLPADLPYDAESAARYKAWSHAAGLTPRQAQSLHDAFVRDQAQAYARHDTAFRARGEETHRALVRDWGEPTSRAYVENLQFADRFVANNGGEALLGELKAGGLVSGEGAVLSPLLAKAMARAGRALYAEDQFVTGARPGRTPDPARTLYPHDPFLSRG